MNCNSSPVAHSLRSVLAALFALFFVGSVDTTRAESSAGPPSETFPSSRVLLLSEPTLFTAPGGTESDQSLPLEAGDTVAVEKTASDPVTDHRWMKVSREGVQGWLPEAWLAPEPQEVGAGDLTAIGAEPVDRWRGIAPDYIPPDLVSVGYGWDRDLDYRLREEAAAALEELIAAARKAGHRLEVVSAYRSYDLQRSNYLSKLRRSGFDQKTVAKPGHSEHQLGTAVDLTGADDVHLLRQSFGETPEGHWLLEHAPDFGFAISYTEANEPLTGYAYEPWHYRYYGAAAPAIHEAALAGKPRPFPSK